MTTKGITLLGLGPGDADLITRQAWKLISKAGEIHLRTIQHPVVTELPQQIQIHAFDDLYENSNDYEEVYERIVDSIIELGKRPEGVIYAVPGHPFIAESTSPKIALIAKELGLPVQIVEGLSFLEPVCSALGIDPIQNTVLLDAFDLANAYVPYYPPSLPAIISQMHSKYMASEVKLTLMEIYPDHHQVKVVNAAGTHHQDMHRLRC